LSHERIQSEGWVELYVRRRLSPADNAAFEDHFFQCDQCFAEVEEMERFVSGVRDAGRRGLLDRESDSAPTPVRWLMPAFVFAMSAVVLLAGVLAYMALVRLPDSEMRLQAALAGSARSESQLAELSRRASANSANAGPQANLPVVILTANRSANDAPDRLTIDPQTKMALLWIDIPPQPAGAKFQITIASDGGPGETIHGLERNENGALAAGVPIDDLAAGAYVIRLYPEQAPARMIAEYRMIVSRK
jgi:hypothetical protein